MYTPIAFNEHCCWLERLPRSFVIPVEETIAPKDFSSSSTGGELQPSCKLGDQGGSGLCAGSGYLKDATLHLCVALCVSCLCSVLNFLPSFFQGLFFFYYDFLERGGLRLLVLLHKTTTTTECTPGVAAALSSWLDTAQKKKSSETGKLCSKFNLVKKSFFFFLLLLLLSLCNCYGDRHWARQRRVERDGNFLGKGYIAHSGYTFSFLKVQSFFLFLVAGDSVANSTAVYSTAHKTWEQKRRSKKGNPFDIHSKKIHGRRKHTIVWPVNPTS